MTAVATRPRRPAKSAQPAASNLPPAVDVQWQNEIACLTTLSAVLDQAANAAEGVTWSGESERLLRVARELADHLIIDPSQTGADGTISNRAFTIAALVKAALQVPGDIPSPERRAFIDQAQAQLVSLTDCAEVLEGWETYPAAKTLRAAPPTEARKREAIAAICAHCTQAEEIVRVTAEHDGTSHVWGLLTLMGCLSGKMQAHKDLDDLGSFVDGAFPDAYGDIQSTLAILELVNQAEQDQLLYAAATLLQTAMQASDAMVEAMRPAKQECSHA